MAYNYSKDKEALIRLRKCFTTPNAFYEDGIFFDENWDSKAYLEEGEDNKKNKQKAPVKDGSIHRGHRQRMREQFLKYGFESFTEYQVLEFLLFHSLPQGDTNPIAHKLIDKFGSLKGVLKADYRDLMQVTGVKEVTAALLTIHRELGMYLSKTDYEGERLYTSKDTGKFCCNYFSHHVVEEAILIIVDADRKIQAIETISKGNETHTAFSPRTIIKLALMHRGCYVIIAHNHPDENPQPSNNDIFNTNKLIPALREFDVIMIDHIVCGGNQYTSMSEKGLLTE